MQSPEELQNISSTVFGKYTDPKSLSYNPVAEKLLPQILEDVKVLKQDEQRYANISTEEIADTWATTNPRQRAICKIIGKSSTGQSLVMNLTDLKAILGVNAENDSEFTNELDDLTSKGILVKATELLRSAKYLIENNQNKPNFLQADLKITQEQHEYNIQDGSFEGSLNTARRFPDRDRTNYSVRQVFLDNIDLNFEVDFTENDEVVLKYKNEENI